MATRYNYNLQYRRTYFSKFQFKILSKAHKFLQKSKIPDRKISKIPSNISIKQKAKNSYALRKNDFYFIANTLNIIHNLLVFSRIDKWHILQRSWKMRPNIKYNQIIIANPIYFAIFMLMKSFSWKTLFNPFAYAFLGWAFYAEILLCKVYYFLYSKAIFRKCILFGVGQIQQISNPRGLMNCCFLSFFHIFDIKQS